MSQRTRHLFNKAFQLVTSSVWKNEGLEGLPISEVLKLRAVCSHWGVLIEKMIVEKFQQFEELSVDIRDAFSSINENRWFHNFMEEDTNKKDSLQKFLRHFEISHGNTFSKARNPLVWGDISVQIICADEDPGADEYENYLTFLEDLSTMLSKYGSHFHDFHLNIDGGKFFNHESLSLLRKWLLYMPHLTEITIQDSMYWAREEELNLGNPFPNLKLLKSLTTCGIPELLLYELIRQNGHISTLEIDRWNVCNNISILALPNLTKFEIKLCSVVFFESFCSPHIQWPLKSLTILCIDRCNINLDALLQCIEDKFADTLVSLNLGVNGAKDMPKSAVWQELKNCRLGLPKLRRIKLGMGSNMVCLDFLLPTKKNLEIISINICYKFPLAQNTTGTSGTIVQFLGFEEKMLESNVWVLFKMLKKIIINCGSTFEYTRDEWLKSNSNEYV